MSEVDETAACGSCGLPAANPEPWCLFCAAALRGDDVGLSTTTVAHMARMFHVLEERLRR